MSDSVSGPGPAGPQPHAPGKMRPVHDGADPVDEARRRIRSRLDTAQWWLTLAICLTFTGRIGGLFGTGWVSWVATAAILVGAFMVLELVVWPPIARRATLVLLARQIRRNAL